MNEIQLLREQLAAERRHVREIARTCAAACRGAPAPRAGELIAALCEASTDYLECVLDWFEQRDERLGELGARLTEPDAGRRARAALESLRTAGPAPDAWAAFAQLINGPWDTRRGAVEALLASNPRVADWRAIGGIDADSMYQERALYARVRAALPAGIGPAAGPA